MRSEQSSVPSPGISFVRIARVGIVGNWGRSGYGEGRTFNILERMVAHPEGGEGRKTIEAG